MKVEWISYLRDPIDGSEFALTEARVDQGRVTEGKLVSRSGHVYPIRAGIPVLVTERTQSKESVKSFAYEWDEFGFLFAKEGWVRDIAGPLAGGIGFFRDKVVVDAGAGSGAQSRWMAESGAKQVFSLELSDTIFTRHRETIKGYEDVIFPIQCDIASPPLAIRPDVVYCVNVLQHTASPPRTFAKLAALMSERTTFLFNVYTKRSEFKFQLVRGVRGAIRLLPFRLWKWLAFGITCVGYPIAKLPFCHRIVRMVVPISHSFQETWLDVYDAFGAHHYQQNMTRADQLRMIAETGLTVARTGEYGYALCKAAPELKQKRA
jgi:uncharacterized protein YbaR (Trm112 family)